MATNAELKRPEARLATAAIDESDGLTWLPAWRLRQLIGDREVSPVEVTEHFLGRIEDHEPVLRAFRHIDQAGAREQAHRAEKAVLDGEELGPLHGIPTAIKELIPIKGMPWQNLSTDQLELAERDSIEAERLRKAGAVIVGATVSQGADRDPDHAPRNPWDIERTPGGSSLGSAAAVAGGLLPASVCTDGRGSTRLPAAFSGLAGIRGTRGRVAAIHEGIINPKLLTDSGPITRDIRDIALFLQVLAGPDGRDPVCLQSAPPVYDAWLGRALEGMRLAWTDDFGYAGRHASAETPAVIEAVRQAAFRVAGAGATVEAIGDVWEDPDFATSMVHVFDPVLNDRIRGRLQATIDTGAAARVEAQSARGRIWDKFHELYGRFDFILSPTVGFTALKVADMFDIAQAKVMAGYSTYTSAANLLGSPAISIPGGFVNGLPVGLQIMGPPDSEPRMLQLAQALLQTQA